MIRRSVTAAASFAAGFLARSELARRRAPKPRPQLRDVLGGDAWVLGAVARVKGRMEAGESARNITIATVAADGTLYAYGVDRGDPEPVRAVEADLLVDGETVRGWVEADIPRDPSGLGGCE